MTRQVHSLLDLEPWEFWTDPFRTQADLSSRLVFSGAGLLVDAPPQVPVDVRQTAPVVICRYGSRTALCGAPLARHGVLTAVDLDYNVTHVGRLMPEARPAPLAGRPGARKTVAFACEMQLAELRQGLGLEWRPGRFLVTVLLQDQISNRVEVELGPASGWFQDEAVALFLRQKQLETVPGGFPSAGSPYPSYAPGDDPLPVPELGIRMAVERVTALKSGASCVLRGSFRLPALPHETFFEREGQEPSACRAAVGISLLMTGSEDGEPALFRFAAPCYQELQPADGQSLARGHFAFDLLKLPGVSWRPQTYFIHALSGRVLEGPLLCSFVQDVPGSRRRQK